MCSISDLDYTSVCRHVGFFHANECLQATNTITRKFPFGFHTAPVSNLQQPLANQSGSTDFFHVTGDQPKRVAKGSLTGL